VVNPNGKLLFIDRFEQKVVSDGICVILCYWKKNLMLFLMKIHMIVVFDPEKCKKYVKLGFVEKISCAAAD